MKRSGSLWVSFNHETTAPNSAIYCQKQPPFRMMRIPLGITSPSLCLYHLSLALPYNIRWSGRCWESFSKRQMRAEPRCSASACHLSNAQLKPRSKCNFALFYLILIWTNVHHSFYKIMLWINVSLASVFSLIGCRVSRILLKFKC